MISLDASWFMILIALMGVVSVVIGLGALVAPQPMSRNYGIELHDQGLPYVRALGVRDVFMGGVLLVTYMFDLVQFGVFVLLMLGLVALADCILVITAGQKKMAILHGLAAVVSCAAAFILYRIY